MKKNKISVIVPVYNAESYLEKCICSLIEQTMDDIEIIAINDGSTDKSLNILNKYSDKIKIIDQMNSGVAEARNSGIKIAKGEYIAFVDSDDYIEKNMFELMYNKAKEGNYDAVQCNFYYLYDDRLEEANKSDSFDVLNDNDKKKYIVNLFPVIWNKIYKRENIKEFYFKKGVWAEDVEYLYRIISKINTIGFIDDKLYYYYQREKSESRLFDKRIYNYISNFNGLIEFYKDNKLYNKYYNELEFIYVRYLYATFVKRATFFENKEDYEEAVNAAIKNVREQFPKYRNNKYFYKSIKGIYLVLFNRFMANIMYLLVSKNNK